MTPLDIAVEVAGWSGAALILLGYLLISTGRLTGQSPAYQWINLAGAIGFAINGWWHGAIPSTALRGVGGNRGLRAQPDPSAQSAGSSHSGMIAPSRLSSRRCSTARPSSS